MDQFFVVLNQIGMFILLIAVGVLTVRLDILDEASLRRLSQLIMKVLLPSYIFVNTAEGATRAGLAQSLLAVPLTAIMYVLLFLLARLLVKCFRLSGDRQKVFHAITIFGNVGFMGIPLVVELYPQTALLYVSLFTILDQSLFWTYGVEQTKPVSAEKTSFSLRRLKKLISPALVAILLATALVLLDLKLPAVLSSTFSKIGAASMPLSLIYIGGMLSMTDVRKVLRCGELYGEIVLKMLVLPVLFYLGMRLFSVPQDLAGTMAFLSGLPAINMVAMLAKNNGSDGEYAVCAVMMTTLACLITLPLVSLFIGLIG